MKLTGDQYREFQKAMEQAFISTYELRAFIKFNFEEDLEKIAGGTTSSEIIFNVIQWAESNGKISELITKAYKEKKGNIFFREFYDKYIIVNLVQDKKNKINYNIAKFRYFIDIQIKRYAKSKYIQGLYVQRKIQDEIVDFHSSEENLALQLRKYAILVVDEIKNDFSNDTRILIDFSIIFALLKKKGIFSKIKIDVKHDDNNSHGKNMHKIFCDFLAIYEHIEDLKNNFIKIDTAIENISDAILNLSDKKLLNQDAVHSNLSNQMSYLLELINNVGNVYNAKNKKVNFIIGLLDFINVLLSEPYKKYITENSLHKLKDVHDRMNSFYSKIFKNSIHQIDNLLSKIQKATSSCFIIIDRAGGGKTTILCEMAYNTVKSAPAMLFFGKENYLYPDSIIKKVKDNLREFFSIKEDDPMELVDKALEDRGIFLHIFIDGINECRKIADLDIAIVAFLEWSKQHRIRITMSCRDIYWIFFDHEKWNDYVYKTLQNSLYQFTLKEFSEASSLYLKHYKIDCVLSGKAELACRHPLLLRFFCEAYGNPDGDITRLGTIKDIRLKELFDIYFDKKMEQIRQALSHRNTDFASRFLMDLSEYLFINRTTNIYTSAIEEATGYSDTSTQDSVYIRLLDEDIILEEQPTTNIEDRKVYFVYEEFMEYVLARAFIFKFRKIESSNFIEVVEELKSTVNEWINARGVVEYIILMLLSSNNKNDTYIGLELLNKLIIKNEIWINAFWSIVGKLPVGILTEKLFDMFYNAISIAYRIKKSIIKDAMMVMSKYSTEGANKLASIVLWSTFLPNVLKWSDIASFDKMSQDDFTQLVAQLISATKNNIKHERILGLKYDELIKWILPYMDDNTKKFINNTLDLRGKPQRHNLDSLEIIMYKLFPEQQAYLINGLFSSNEKLQIYCADHIRFIRNNQLKISIICREISKVHENQKVCKVLINSADWMANFSIQKKKEYVPNSVELT